jgi:hypothetical protein
VPNLEDLKLLGTDAIDFIDMLVLHGVSTNVNGLLNKWRGHSRRVISDGKLA